MGAVDTQTRKAREELVEGFFEGTGRSYDRVVAVTTLGFDARWKQRVLGYVPAGAKSILDLACGTGILTLQLHRMCPSARVVGVDFTDEYLAVARAKFEQVEADVSFLNSNAETMELEGTFDTVVSSYIPKYVDPDVLLDRLAGHLEPGAVLALHDFNHPSRMIPRGAWNAHMWLIKALGRRIFPEWNVCFDEKLAQLIRESNWTDRYRHSLDARGFVDVRRKTLTCGTAAIVSGRWPGC